MHLQRTYYEVLGVAPGASLADIKKKYRELARKFHPDLAQDKKLGQKIFTQVNQAYRVLSDPERRSQYDATLEPPSTARTLRPANVTEPSSSIFQSNGGVVFPSSGPQGSGQSPPRVNPKPAPKVESKPAPPPPPPPIKPAEVAALLNEADDALMKGDAAHAKSVCESILKSRPDNANALGLYGDALAQLKETEAAASAYLKALQIAPTSLLEAKLKRLQFTSKASQKSTEDTSANNEPKPGKPPSPPEKRSGGMFGRILGRK